MVSVHQGVKFPTGAWDGSRSSVHGSSQSAKILGNISRVASPVGPVQTVIFAFRLPNETSDGADILPLQGGFETNLRLVLLLDIALTRYPETGNDGSGFFFS